MSGAEPHFVQVPRHKSVCFGPLMWSCFFFFCRRSPSLFVHVLETIQFSISEAEATAFLLICDRVIATFLYIQVRTFPYTVKAVRVLLGVVQSKINISVAADKEINGARFPLPRSEPSPSPCTPPRPDHCAAKILEVTSSTPP